MPLLWRFVAWYLGRTLTPGQLTATLGDLTEDFETRTGTRGRTRAVLWLLGETRSVSAAYRAQTAEVRRGSRRTIMSGSWLGDLRFAARRLRRHPAAAIASMVTLASAIAAGAVTWSLLSALLLAPLPVHDPDSLVVVGARRQLPDGQWSATSYTHLFTLYPALRDSGVFERVAAAGRRSLLVAPEQEAVPQARSVLFVTHDFFEVLGVRLDRGPGFRSTDDRAGAPLTAIVSYRYWRSALDGDPDVLDREIRVSDGHATIVGVAPPRFRGLSLADAPDVYLPLHTAADVISRMEMDNPFNDGSTPGAPTAWIMVVGRLGATGADAMVAHLNALSPRGRFGALDLMPVNTAAIPEPAREAMAQFSTLLAVTVGLLVLIGCATVGMLLLVRTQGRRGELAVCLALGGTRSDLARGIALEGGLLTLAGCALAVPAAHGILLALRAFQLPGRVSVDLLDLSFGLSSWLVTGIVAIAMLTAIVLVAGVLGSSATVTHVLHARSGSTPVTTRRHMRMTLVAAQVAVALVLLAGAGLFSRSVTAALTLNPGFEASRIVAAPISLLEHGYPADRADAFFAELRAGLDGDPSITAVSIARRQGGRTGPIVVNGVSRELPSFLAYTAVDERYFSTMEIPILEGRNFSAADTATSPLVIIVSESFARAFAGSGSAVGLRIAEIGNMNVSREVPGEAEVVGVVPDVITNIADTAPLVKYYTMAQARSWPRATVVARARGDSSATKRAVLGAVRGLDPQVDPTPLLTIEEQLAQQMAPQQLGRFVLGSLGTIAFLLTLLGAYVLAETMSSGRRREFSIRAALGASRAALAGAVLGETVRLVGMGLLAGLALAWMGANMIRALLFRIEPLDPATLLTASGTILALALVVSLGPARDAARVDLVRTLREE